MLTWVKPEVGVLGSRKPSTRIGQRNTARQPYSSGDDALTFTARLKRQYENTMKAATTSGVTVVADIPSPLRGIIEV